MSMLRDAATIARRNMIRIGRVPEVMVFVLVQPLMFVLLFAFVFGGSIDIPGGSYREFLIAGIFAQTVVFGATFTASGLAEDVQKGLINRFRSLPMARSAVVAGRTASDVVYNGLSVVIMSLAGLAVGWRIRGSVLDAVVAYLLLLFFSYSFSWVMAFIGMSVRSPEIINNVSFLVLFPLTFISNAFVPAETLPTPLRIFAEWNPVSALVQAARELFGNTAPGTPVGDAWTAQNPILTVLLGMAVMLAIFVPLSIRKFQSISSR